jgi:RsiW-degrading membrane proteinase PrsW (M82 family)
MTSAVILGCSLLTLMIITRQTGPFGLAAGAMLAAIPVVPVVGAFLWLDRYEAEPTGLLVFAFTWGAGVATFGALVINTASMKAIQHAGANLSVAAVLVAPVVEESLKGLAVLAIFAVRRQEFDGIVDGIVYAGMTAAGFAFVENVLYLGRTLAENGPSRLVFVFVLRCLVSPFAHPLFTSATGIGLGLAVQCRSRWGRVLLPIGGWALAVTLHGTFNAGTTVGVRGFATGYVLIQLPVFLAFVALAVAGRGREGRLIGRNLAIYCASGWLTQAEVTMLATLSTRRSARVWARRTGGPAALRAMRVFQELGTELAFLRERLRSGSADVGAPERELAILEALGACRALYLPGERA